MTLRSYPRRLFLASVASSFAAFGFCGLLAVHLYQEQSRTAAVLRENVESRRAAARLEDTVAELIVKLQAGSGDIEALHERIERQLEVIQKYANKEAESQLAVQLEQSYRDYQKNHAALPASARATALANQLQLGILPTCRRMREFNVEQIEESEREHAETARRMEWGLAVVGSLGSLAGLVLGYALARGLRRTIHDLLVRVHGASELLAQEVPAVEWQVVGEPTGDGIDDLLLRVESVVRRLQEREREVRRAERLAAVGQLAAGIAHEIRNPLTSATLLVETARNDPSAGGITDEDLGLIEQELHRMERSLRTFLDYARPPTLRRSRFDLADVVREVLSLTRGRIEQQRVEVRLEAPVAGWPVIADRDQIRQVLLNLILNALDAMPRGGVVTVSMRQAGDSVELAVADTGQGIAPALLARLFEPFASSKETGLGLGLAVSRRIVDDHDGTIEGFNLVNGGACFTVRLPRGD